MAGILSLSAVTDMLDEATSDVTGISALSASWQRANNTMIAV